MTAKILIIDDEVNICYTFDTFLSEEGYHVETAMNYNEALAKIDKISFDLIVADIILDGKTGIDLLKVIKQRNLNCPVVMITGAPTMETAMEAVRLGAYDYIPKPVDQGILLSIARTALRYKALVDENDSYRLNLEAIFKSVKDAMVTANEAGVIIELNQAAKDQYRFWRGQNIWESHQTDLSICQEKCLKALRETLETKEAIESKGIECCLDEQSGRVINLSTYPLLNRLNQISGGVLIIRDETRLSNLEKNLKKRQRLHNMVGKSEKMQEIYALIDSMADIRTTVLIGGESGTGKELVAEALHYKGVCHDKPFVKVNCGALSENLLESELFGHVKGAFSGAIKDRIGRFQKADRGTIFLDEIGEISQKMQIKLLRVIQDMEFERVGDSSPVKVDIRVIAATNKNLRNEIKNGNFRADLFYRLKVVEIQLPPLKERPEDISLLTAHFISDFNKQFNQSITGVSDEVKEIFYNYAWPGNIRELKHALEFAFVYCRESTILVRHLPIELKKQSFRPKNNEDREDVMNALTNTRWNKTAAADALGISRQSLYRKIKRYGLDIDN